MTEDNQSELENIVCSCGKEISQDDAYSFQDKLYCKSCYFKESKLGPFHNQYKNCSNCGESVHIFTIRCPHCGTPVHETGSINAKKPIKSSVILAYGIIALIIVVSALTIPGFSNKGILAWVSTITGAIFSLHGLLGFMFFFLPFGFKTIYRFNAFSIGFLETALGFFLLIWPKL